MNISGLVWSNFLPPLGFSQMLEIYPKELGAKDQDLRAPGQRQPSMFFLNRIEIELSKKSDAVSERCRRVRLKIWPSLQNSYQCLTCLLPKVSKQINWFIISSDDIWSRYNDIIMMYRYFGLFCSWVYLACLELETPPRLPSDKCVGPFDIDISWPPNHVDSMWGFNLFHVFSVNSLNF